MNYLVKSEILCSTFPKVKYEQSCNKIALHEYMYMGHEVEIENSC